MMNAIFTAFTAFFSMITTLCNAGDKGAKAVDELAGWAHESAAAFHDESKHNRALSLEEMRFKRMQQERDLTARKLADEQAQTAITQASAKGGKNSTAVAA